MKRFIAFFVLLALASCSPQKKYSDFDYSYSRSGGLSPIYENLWIKGKNAHYSFEGQGKNVKKDGAAKKYKTCCHNIKKSNPPMPFVYYACKQQILKGIGGLL